jgi:hypothetical protein
MARLTTQKTSFTAGEISPTLLGRGDLRAYQNGAAKLKNIFIHPTGGLSRRSGLRHVDIARGVGRLVPFEFNTEQVYLFIFTDLKADIYKNDTIVTSIDCPWNTAEIKELSWIQSADTLLIVHPNHLPRKIIRNTETDWQVVNWQFVEEDQRIQQPHHKFSSDAHTLQASGTSGTITLTASADVFVSAHLGTRLRIQNKEVEITAVNSPVQVSATVKETLASTSATKDWEEQTFSAVRGWPVSCCFHQDRLVIGGSRDLPNQLWLSKSSDLFNFDLGEGLDDEAIEFAVLSDQVNSIRTVFSGRHLQIFTSGAEWMATGSPISPTNIQLHRQTRVGSPVERWVPPRDVDGATLFIPRDGSGLREFLFADVEQAYQATDLGTLAKHLISNPFDQDYDASNRLFHIVMESGYLATVTIYRAEQVTARTRQETNGLFRSLAVVGEHTYVLVERNGDHFIERFEPALNLDATLSLSSSSAKSTWTGLDHLEGLEVGIVADGSPVPSQMVTNGQITLDDVAFSLDVGLIYTHLVELLPPSIQTQNGGNQDGRLRPVAITFRLKDTAALHLDTGRGIINVPFKGFGDNVLDAPPISFSGDKTVRVLGWHRDGTKSLWRIEQSAPLPFSLLSVATEFSING